MKHVCNNCQMTFGKPYIELDENGDEQYDLCPFCKSDDFREVNSYALTEEQKDVMAEEYHKCTQSPHYFATKYLRIKTNNGWKKFETPLSEQQFNSFFETWQKPLK